MNLEKFVDKNFKFLVALMCCVLLGCIAAIITMLIIGDSMRHAYVSITVAPTTAKVTLNGKEYRTGSYAIEPGEYNVKIEAEGFETKEFKIKAEKSRLASVETYLLNKEEGLAYFERSANDMSVLKYIYSKDFVELNDFMEQYQKKYEIVYYLPFNADASDAVEDKVKIEDGSNRKDCDMALCLVASGYNIDKAKVEESIRTNGFKPEDYKIIYNYYKEEE
ncbi:PEGA domain-containing protein [Candidatus Saccharibacteria bacterium]|nr:PEGA domain-containing protein [Candidatus Saccharibacteria bacterium]